MDAETGPVIVNMGARMANSRRGKGNTGRERYRREIQQAKI
jgi:hypothetical protein